MRSRLLSDRASARTCLLLGGGGFLGHHLARELAATQWEVRVLSRSLKCRRIPGVLYRKEAITTRARIAAAIATVDAVVYLAHPSVPATSEADPEIDVAQGLLPLVRVLQVLRSSKRPKRFVYLSSGGTVYGNACPSRPIGETVHPKPISLHGLAKLTAEWYVRLILGGGEITTVILRISNAYGEHQQSSHQQGAVAAFLRAAATDTPVTLFGQGAAIRDFVHAQDVATAIGSCLDTNPSTFRGPRTLNVGSGQGISVRHLLKTIERITGRKIKTSAGPSRPFDCPYNVLDISAIQTLTRWRPTVSLEDGLYRTWRWVQTAAAPRQE